MKTVISIVLVLCLALTLFTACGEKQATTVTTTIAENVTTTTALDDTATTTATETAVTTTIVPVTTKTTTVTPTTTTTKRTISTVNPTNYKDNHYYVGAIQPDGNGLVRPRLLFEGEYCVIMHYMYSATKEDDEQQPFEYQGKTYYGQGEGMSPCLFEMTATEILVKNMNEGTVLMKLVLQSDGNMKVTATTDASFPVGLVLTPTAQ